MVEFALVLPVLALLLFGVIQFGIAFNNYITLTDAVRAGARKAAVSRNESNPPAVTEDEVRRSAAGLDPNTLTVSVSSDWKPTHDVKVSANYPYNVHLLGIVVMSGQLSSQTTERVE